MFHACQWAFHACQRTFHACQWTFHVSNLTLQVAQRMLNNDRSALFDGESPVNGDVAIMQRKRSTVQAGGSAVKPEFGAWGK
jgi:hypothetical protein